MVRSARWPCVLILLPMVLAACSGGRTGAAHGHQPSTGPFSYRIVQSRTTTIGTSNEVALVYTVSNIGPSRRAPWCIASTIDGFKNLVGLVGPKHLAPLSPGGSRTVSVDVPPNYGANYIVGFAQVVCSSSKSAALNSPNFATFNLG